MAVVTRDSEEGMNLEDYLDDQYNRDLQDISKIEEVLADVANTSRFSRCSPLLRSKTSWNRRRVG